MQKSDVNLVYMQGESQLQTSRCCDSVQELGLRQLAFTMQDQWSIHNTIWLVPVTPMPTCKHQCRPASTDAGRGVLCRYHNVWYDDLPRSAVRIDCFLCYRPASSLFTAGFIVGLLYFHCRHCRALRAA
ncbi:hypothetical protein GQ53DRAFT_450504 [Thozetella sp. PMI_491]|nr:hypothetical protein GQ53DRAFT_450504 [Thozetella sp. PMI_491]